MIAETALKNLVRVGTVSSVDEGNRTARVQFADKQDTDGKPLISGALKVLKNPPFIPEHNVTQETEEKEGHKHEVIIKPWLPKTGDFVLCLFLPNGDSDGFVVGGI